MTNGGNGNDEEVFEEDFEDQDTDDISDLIPVAPPDFADLTPKASTTELAMGRGSGSAAAEASAAATAATEAAAAATTKREKKAQISLPNVLPEDALVFFKEVFGVFMQRSGSANWEVTRIHSGPTQDWGLIDLTVPQSTVLVINHFTPYLVEGVASSTYFRLAEPSAYMRAFRAELAISPSANFTLTTEVAQFFTNATTRNTTFSSSSAIGTSLFNIPVPLPTHLVVAAGSKLTATIKADVFFAGSLANHNVTTGSDPTNIDFSLLGGIRLSGYWFPETKYRAAIGAMS